MKRPTILLVLAALWTACTPQTASEGPQQMWVTIAPLRYIVEGITGDDFRVEVLVPPGASPETFEPTARQFAALNRGGMIFGVGLIDFERNLLSKVDDPSRVIELSDGIDPIAGTCTHAHHDHEHGHAHAHGVDPHVWTSPRELRTMTENAYRAIRAAYPDSTRYEANYRRLDTQLQRLDEEVGRRIAESGVDYFLIYHPALSYYARAYGIRQIAIEDEGKEPSARRIGRLIADGRRDGIRNIFYQRQFPASSVEVIARDLGGQAVEIDPLSADVPQNILNITDLIIQRR